MIYDLVVTLLDGQLEPVATLVVLRAVSIEECDAMIDFIVWAKMAPGINFYGDVFNVSLDCMASA